MKRFLVIDWGLIGDVLCTTPLFSTIKKSYPDSHVTVITKPYSYEILKNNPYIDKVFILNKKSHTKDSSKSLQWLDLIGLFFNKYDYCIDLYGSSRSAVITLSSRAKERITIHNYGKILEKIAYNSFVSSEVSCGLQAYLAPLCDKLECRFESFKPEFYFSAKDAEIAEKLIVNDSKKQVGIFVGASWEAKRWPLVNVKELIEGSNKEEVQFYIIFGPLETDEFKKECLDLFPGIPVINNVSLPVFGALIKKLDLLVSNDSGPIHIAKAVETPCIGLFGPNHPEAVNLQKPSISISGYDSCSYDRGETKSCQNHKCATYECIKSISVAEVREELLRILSDQKVAEV